MANQQELDTFADASELTHHLSLASLQHGKGQIRATDILSEGATAQDNEPKHYTSAKSKEGHDSATGPPQALDAIVIPQHRKYDPNSMLYTDGGYKQGANWSRGLWPQRWHRAKNQIKQSKPGPVHTVNRVEVVQCAMLSLYF